MSHGQRISQLCRKEHRGGKPRVTQQAPAEKAFEGPFRPPRRPSTEMGERAATRETRPRDVSREATDPVVEPEKQHTTERAEEDSGGARRQGRDRPRMQPRLAEATEGGLRPTGQARPSRQAQRQGAASETKRANELHRQQRPPTHSVKRSKGKPRVRWNRGALVAQWVTDLALSLQRLRSLRCRRSAPWPGNLHVPRARPETMESGSPEGQEGRGGRTISWPGQGTPTAQNTHFPPRET